MKEIFINIPGYENYYQISNFGNVRRFGKIKNLSLKNRAQIILSVDGIRSKFFVSHLMIKSFLPNITIKENECICHLDKNNLNNAITNLSIMTKSESRKLDYKLGKCINWGIERLHDLNRIEYEKIFYIYDNDTHTHSICIKCFKELEIKYFYHNKKYHDRICKNCTIETNVEHRRITNINARSESR